MAKIPGFVFLFIGIAVFVVTAYAPFEKSAKTLFTVIAALLIVYGIGSMAIDYSSKKKKANETKRARNDSNAKANPLLNPQMQRQQMRQQYPAQQPARVPQGAVGFCSVCGSVARADDNFCGKCGSRLR